MTNANYATFNALVQIAMEQLKYVGDNDVVVDYDSGTINVPKGVQIFRTPIELLGGCVYCGTRGGEGKFHPGTCGNCGAPLEKG